MKKKIKVSIRSYYQWVLSHEIRPLAALYPPPPSKENYILGYNLELRSRSPLLVIAQGGRLMLTVFAPLSIVSQSNMGGEGKR